MKKFLVFAIILAVAGVYGIAAELSINADEAAKVESSLTSAKSKSDKQAVYPSTGASERGSVTFSFRAELKGTLVSNPEYTNTFKSTKTCRAVVIDKNWLLASKNCAVNDDYVMHSAYRGAGSAPDQEKYEVTARYYSDYRISVGNTSYAVTVFDIGNEFLIYAKNNKLAAELNKLPKANILVTGNKASLNALKSFPLIIRRDSRFSGEVSDEMEAESVCTGSYCVKVESKFFHPDGAAGDPMFIKLDNNQEFLVAFNAAQNYSAQKNKGRDYKTITPTSAEKIKSYVKKYTPSAYNTMVRKIVKKINVIKKSYSFE